MTIRVAHILDGRFFGGAEQMVRRLAKSSPKIGVEAAIYCLAEGRLSEMLRADHLPLRVFPSSGRLDFRPLGAMTRALRGDQIQIIQAHTSRTHLLARILSHRVGIPNITTIQSPIALDENQGTQSHPLRAWIERAGRRWTDHLCPVSREETERLIREEGVPKDKITCIPNGVEAVETKSVVQARATDAARALAGLGISMDGFLLAMIAQLRPRKGPEVLIRAFGKFLAGGGEGALLMIGDDEFTEGRRYVDELKDLASNCGLGSRVHFAGFQCEPWELAECADAIVLPSLFGEGLPLTLIEAMNHARAVLASDTMGNRECVLHGETGWLHAPGDEAKLAEQIALAANNREALANMGLRGRGLFIEKFEMGKILADWEKLYTKLAR